MFELFQDSTEESLKSLKPTQDVEPGFFANAVSGTGKLIAKSLASIPRNISMAGSLVPRAIDELTAFTMGTKPPFKQLTATENYFKWHDEFFQRSVDYWEPKPNEVGMAGQIVGGVLPVLAQVIANPAFAVANQSLETSINLAIQDPNLTATQVNAVGAVQGAGLALGVWMPATFGATLPMRVGVGVGSNVALGAVTRGVSAGILGDSPTAKGFEWNDPAQVTIDTILGGAFGAAAHFIPSMRAQTAQDWDRFKNWAQGLKPSEIDALAVLRLAQHKNQDSMPGVPVTPEAVQTHVDRLNAALERLMRDEPVGEVPRGTSQQDIDNAQNLRNTLREQAISRVGQEAYDAGVQAHLESMGNLAPDQVEVERAIVALRIAQDFDLKQFGAKATQTPDEIAAAEQRVREQVSAQEPFAVDTARQAAAEAQLRYLTAEAERIRVAEGLPRPPIPEAARPPKDITPLDPIAQAQAVGRHIEQKLLETGMQKAEAVANAAIWEAFAKSAHDRYGITPAELMTKFGVDVRRMDSADQLLGAMEQRYEQSAATKIDTPEFKRWFGDSKVVDAQGKPLRVYHSTTYGDFDTFTKSEQRKGMGGYGFYFTDQSGSNIYANYGMKFQNDRSWRGDDKKVNIMPVYLDMKNPLYVEDMSEVLKRYGNRDPGRFGQAREYGGMGESAKTAIQRDGYDGVIGKEYVKRMRDNSYKVVESGTKGAIEHPVYVVFEPEQIKSATGNRGTFDPNNPNILYQDKPFYSELARQIDGAKTTSAPAKGWKDTIKGLVNKGVVKQTEVEATGLNDWLDLQEGKVTKQQLQDFIAQNGVRVDEVTLGTADAERAGREMAESQGNVWSELSPVDRQRYIRVAGGNAINQDLAGATKFDQYQLPGGENYRELLLTLPEKQTPESPEALKAKREAATLQFLKDFEEASGLERWQTAGWFVGNPGNWETPYTNMARQAMGTNAFEVRRTELQSLYDAQIAAQNDQAAGRFTSSHFSQPNILAHIRFNERTDADGKRVLFIEEIQSDWAQKGKKEGFAIPGAREKLTELVKQYDALNNERLDVRKKAAALPDGGPEFEGLIDRSEQITKQLDDLQVKMDNLRSSLSEYAVPTAPFVGKTEAWVALSLKRMIRYAAENGFDRIAWTNGEQQVSRYTNALRKQVDVIEWKKTKDGVHLVGYKNAGRPSGKQGDYDYVDLDDGTFQIIGADGVEVTRVNSLSEAEALVAEFNSDSLDFTAGQRSKVVDTTEKESVLSDAIGKAMADKIKNDPNESGVIKGQDIKIDDTGMATFYDRIVPNVANDVLKKLGGQRVGEFEITVPINNRTLDVVNENGELILRTEYDFEAWNVARANDGARVVPTPPEQSVNRQTGFDITPEVASKALAGLPLFQGGARGAVSFETGKTLIALFDKADKTTFQHETGHVFLEMTKELASLPTASIRAMQDWATISKWLKLEGGDIPREAHEQWARGWEKYLAEGKAPNNALKQAFKRFRDWIIDVYHSLAGIDSPINNQIRGVMARMLESQAKDPVDKGGLDDPRLQTAEYRDALEKMGREAGWMEVGGSIQRDWGGWEQPGETAQGEVIGRSKWVPYAEWYARMQASPANMPGVSGGGVRRAVQKAVMGEKMTAGEKRTVTWMLDEHMTELKRWEDAGAKAANPDGDAFEAAVIRADEGIESTPENILDMALIDRARELDPEAMEAIPDIFDDAQYMARVREIIDAQRAIEETDQSGRQDAGEAQAPAEYVAQRPPAGADSSPPPPDGGGESAAGATDMLKNEAYRFAAENPDMKVRAGENADGTPIYKSLNDYLEEAAMQTELANQDAALFQVAAECLLGVS